MRFPAAVPVVLTIRFGNFSRKVRVCLVSILGLLSSWNALSLGCSDSIFDITDSGQSSPTPGPNGGVTILTQESYTDPLSGWTQTVNTNRMALLNKGTVCTLSVCDYVYMYVCMYNCVCVYRMWTGDLLCLSMDLYTVPSTCTTQPVMQIYSTYSSLVYALHNMCSFLCACSSLIVCCIRTRAGGFMSIKLISGNVNGLLTGTQTWETSTLTSAIWTLVQ